MTSTGGNPGSGMGASLPNSIKLREGPVTVELSIKVSTRMRCRVTVSPERRQHASPTGTALFGTAPRFDLSHLEQWNLVRSLFCDGGLTALRRADVARSDWGNLHENRTRAYGMRHV